MLAICIALTLFGLAFLHLYWGTGGSWYREFSTPSVNGKPTIQPTGFAYTAVAVGLVLAGLIAVSMVGGQEFHETKKIWAWILSGLFAFRALGDFRLIGFFCKRVDAEHRRVERSVIVPICIFLSIGFARLALTYPS